MREEGSGSDRKSKKAGVQDAESGGPAGDQGGGSSEHQGGVWESSF